MAVNKNDAYARQCLGPAYDALPKSVLALAAYYLARQVHGDTDEDGLAGLRQEINSLGANGMISADQAKRADKALSAQ